MNAKELRDGIFNLKTRRFGTVAEAMVQRLCKLNASSIIFHDLYDDMQKQRVEVKFSTVRKKIVGRLSLITSYNVYKMRSPAIGWCRLTTGKKANLIAIFNK